MNSKTIGTIRSSLTKKLQKLERMGCNHCGNDGAIFEMEQHRREIVDWVVQQILKAHESGDKNPIGN